MEQRARSFGRAAEHYERGRPVWPVAAVDAAGVPPDTHVLDLAAGTGKLTRVLVARFVRVTAVEPDAAMRALNRWGDVRDGSAESIPLRTGEVDAVFVADAFHWFADPPTVVEIARVLRRGGTLALLWNRGEGNWGPPLPGLDELWERLQETSQVEPHPLASRDWRDAFTGAPFGELREAEVEATHRVDRDGVISYLLSQSVVAARPREEVDAVAAELASVVPPGRYELPLRVEVVTTTRR